MGSLVHKKEKEEKPKKRTISKKEDKREQPLNFYQPSEGSDENFANQNNDNDVNNDSGEIIFTNK